MGPREQEHAFDHKETPMDRFGEILRALGRIEGEFIEIRKLSERISRLEQWQSRLKGGWAVLAAACAFLGRAIYGK